MAKIEAKLLTGGKGVALSEDCFGQERNDALVHEVVKGELAARRQGTSATKTRGMVAGGRAKPWRQKGTGRARAGTTRAPNWTGGGVAFGPQPRSYTGKVNRKARVKALRIALSSHALAGSLHVVDGGTFDAPKTSHAAELTRGAELHTPLVVVVGDGELNVAKSFRNLERTHVVPVRDLEVAEVVWARSLVVSKAALAVLEGGESS
jgi:large subunit ribosomal protein L4